MSAPLLFEARGPEFVALRTGEFLKGGRKITVTGADLDRAVENFARWQAAGQAIPVDYDHSFAGGGSSRAAGWIETLRRVGDQLLARVTWTESAREALAAREYAYFSPEFTRSHRNESGEDEGFSLVSGALTNRPFLRGTTRVAFSDERSTEIERLSAEIGEWEMREDVDPEALDQHRLAVELMRDEGLDYRDAAEAAWEELR